MGKFIDITGEKYGRLTAVYRAENSKKGRTRWSCLCDCGNAKIVESHKLVSGHTSSCGCLWTESRQINGCKNNGDKHRIHGMSRHPLDAVYDEMKSRCTKPSNKNYKNYGGRGITVCNEWLINPQMFFKWALSSGYEKGLSLDRKDNENGYFPENCRFTTRVIQANNTRKTINITIGQETKPLYLWAREREIKPHTVYCRIKKYGWTEQEALGFDEPPRLPGQNNLRHKGAI